MGWRTLCRCQYTSVLLRRRDRKACSVSGIFLAANRRFDAVFACVRSAEHGIMTADDDIENQRTQILNPVGYTHAEIAKEEVYSLLHGLWLVSGHTDKALVGQDLRRLDILQREPFLSWIRDWAGGA
jgi:hypothetical protein